MAMAATATAAVIMERAMEGMEAAASEIVAVGTTGHMAVAVGAVMVVTMGAEKATAVRKARVVG